jgi:hypothetical protein
LPSSNPAAENFAHSNLFSHEKSSDIQKSERGS